MTSEVPDFHELPDFMTEWYFALGKIAENSALLEFTLRSAFCALISSKYAGVVAGGQSTEWLIEQCKALTDANAEMADDQRQVIKHALQLCKEANQQRNAFIHGPRMKFLVDGGVLTGRSRRHADEMQFKIWTAEMIRDGVTALVKASDQLDNAIQKVFRPDREGVWRLR